MLDAAAFQDELEKQANLAQRALKVLRGSAMQRGLGGVGAGLGIGGAVGAAGGAGLEGVRSYRQAREAGAGATDAVLEGALGGLAGAMKGGVIGAGVGAAGLGGLAAGSRKASDVIGELAKREGALPALTRGGQRQVHALTGWTPKGPMSSKGARELRAGAYDAAEAAQEAEKTLGKAWKGDDPGALLSAAGKSRRAKEHLKAAVEAEEMGLTSLPGYYRAMRDRGVGRALKTGLKEQWTGGPLGKAFIAAPVGMAAMEAATPGETEGGGRLERAGKALGGLGYALGPIPAAGMMVAGPAITAATGSLGRVGDVATGQKHRRRAPYRGTPLPPSLEPAGGQAVATEYEYSPSAMGQLPEGWGG